MIRVLGTSILTFMIGMAAFASPVVAYHHPFTIGLVEVPKIFGISGYGNGEGTVSLRTSPSLKSPVAQIITKAGQFDRHEHGYNASSAVVYEEKFAWYRVGYSVNGEKGKAWLSPDDAGKYRSLWKLLHGSLTYLRKEWDWRLFEHPSLNAPSKRVPRKSWFTGPVVFAKRRRANGTLWYLVVVLKEDPCIGGKFAHHVVAAGWIPAYSKKGLSNVWFSARGC